MKCAFKKTDGGALCVRCGRFVNGYISGELIADCRPGLGDMVAAGLASVGVTEERVSAVVGGPCGCPERQAALNAIGAKWLGMPPGSTANPGVDARTGMGKLDE